MLEKEKRKAGKILVTESSDRNQFPAGMRVLALDANSVCLKYLVYLLEICRYRVTATTKAEEALQILREKKDNFDIVITDVIRQDIDGFEVLQIVGIEMDMPVIVISANDDQANITRSISHGARDYLLKPVRLQEMRNIWQHVYRKSLNTRQKLYSCVAKEIVDPRSFPLKTVEENLKKEEAETSTQSNSTVVTPGKKTRLTWSPELHIKFVNAIQELGKDAVPNKLLRMMNVPGLTRQNVASHLQKFRNISKKQSSVVSKQRNPLYSVTDLKEKNTKPRELDMYQNYMPSPHSAGQMQQGIRCQVYGNLPSTPLPTRTYLPESDCQLPDIFPGIKLHDGCMGIASQPSRFSINGGWPACQSSRPPSSYSLLDEARHSILDHQDGLRSTRSYEDPSPVGYAPFSQTSGDSSTQMDTTSQQAASVLAWPLRTFLPDQQERSFSFSIRETMGTNLSGKNIVYPDNMQDPNLTDLEGKGKARVVQSFPEHPNMESGSHQYRSSFMDDDLSAMVKEFDNDVPPKL